MRIEDLDDRTHDDVAHQQLSDLAAIGVTWDDQPQWQSRQRERYDTVISRLADRGLVLRMLLQQKRYPQRARVHRMPPKAPTPAPVAR